jgi:hypothetical protein
MVDYNSVYSGYLEIAVKMKTSFQSPESNHIARRCMLQVINK